MDLYTKGMAVKVKRWEMSMEDCWLNGRFVPEKLSISWFFSLDRCSIPSSEVSILWSYLDITLLFSSYVYLILSFYGTITFLSNYYLLGIYGLLSLVISYSLIFTVSSPFLTSCNYCLSRLRSCIISTF